MFKILQARFQQYTNCELPDVQAGFRKGRGTRDKCQHLLDHWKSKRVPEKHLLLLCWLHQSLWLCGSQQTGKFFKKWEYQTPWPASWEICMQVKKQLLELDMEQQTGSKSGKGYAKTVYCHPACLTYMQNTSCKMPGWMRQNMESRWPGEISITSDMQITPSLCQNYRACAPEPRSHNYCSRHVLEPTLHNKRSHCNEKEACTQQLQSSPHLPQLENSWHSMTKTQHRQK